jgi:hypothetical protein
MVVCARVNVEHCIIESLLRRKKIHGFKSGGEVWTNKKIILYNPCIWTKVTHHLSDFLSRWWSFPDWLVNVTGIIRVSFQVKKKPCRITLYIFQSLHAILFHNRDVSSRCWIAGSVKSNNTEQHVGAEGRDKILIFTVHCGQFPAFRFDLRSPSHLLSCIVSFTTENKIKGSACLIAPCCPGSKLCTPDSEKELQTIYETLGLVFAIFYTYENSVVCFCVLIRQTQTVSFFSESHQILTRRLTRNPSHQPDVWGLWHWMTSPMLILKFCWIFSCLWTGMFSSAGVTTYEGVKK